MEGRHLLQPRSAVRRATQMFATGDGRILAELCRWGDQARPEDLPPRLGLAGMLSRRDLFVGDTFDADYVGPTSIGMRAWHLQRAQGDTLLGLVRG